MCYLRLRPPHALATALSELSDAELEALLHATAAEELRRSQDRQRWLPSQVFKTLATGAVLLCTLALSGCGGLMPLQQGTRQVVGVVLQDPSTYELWSCTRDVTNYTPPTQFSRKFRCDEVQDEVTWRKVQP